MGFDATAPVPESVLRQVESLPFPLGNGHGESEPGGVGPDTNGGCDATGLDHLLSLGGESVSAARWTWYMATACASGAAEPGDGLWAHVAAVACAALLIARRLGGAGVPAAQAYLAGLLHDIGKVALRQTFPRAYARAAREARRTRGDIAECERGVFGTDHTVAGRRLAERWRLQPELRESIWLHHVAAGALPATGGSGRLLMVVQLADTLVREHQVGDSGNFSFYERASEIGARLGLDESSLDGIAGRLPALVQGLTRLCGMTGSGETFAGVRMSPDTRGGQPDAHSATSRFLAAYEALGKALPPAARIGEVVRAAADVVAGVLGAEQVGAFALLEGGRRIEAGVSGRETTRTDDVDASALEVAANEGGPIPLPASVAGVVLGADEAGGAKWMALRCEGELVGGVVLPRGLAEAAWSDGEEVPHLGALTGWLAKLMRDAAARGADRRLAEDLADSNRRLQQTQRQLLQRRTLSMIAEMAAGAAHELNGPLTVISGRAQMLKSTTSDPEAARALETIHLRAHECSRIVSELMDFAQPRPPRPEWVDVMKLLSTVAGEYQRGQGGAVRVTAPSAEERMRARLDAGQIALVMRELLDNAGNAVRESGGQISINCRERGTDDYIEITVRDTGVGMTPAVLQRAFDPFFSFHRAGRRRGLGLARALRIVEAHGGRIWIDSRPGAGTCVHVLLPRAGRGDGAESDLDAGTGRG